MGRRRGHKRQSVDRVEEEEEHVITLGATKIVNVRCSPRRLRKMCDNLSEHNRGLVKAMGFGALLEVAAVNVCHRLILWMVENFEVEDCSFTICGKTFPLTAEVFSEIMGLSDGGDDFEQLGTDEEVINRKEQMKGGRSNIRLSDLEADLLDDKLSDDIFIRKFVLFAAGTVLMPTTSIVVGTTLISAIQGVQSVQSLNWATQCRNHLVQAIDRYKKRKGPFIGGCVLFLQVFYLHHVEGHTQFIDRSLLPIAAWTEKKTRDVIRWINASGGYSAKKMRSAVVADSGVRRSPVETHGVHIMQEVSQTKEVVIELNQQLSRFQADIFDSIRNVVRVATAEALHRPNSTAGTSDEVRRSAIDRSTQTDSVVIASSSAAPKTKVAGVSSSARSIVDLISAIDNIVVDYATVFKSVGRTQFGQSMSDVSTSSMSPCIVGEWLGVISPKTRMHTETVVDVSEDCSMLSDSETNIRESITLTRGRDPSCLLKEYVGSGGHKVGKFHLRHVVKPADFCLGMYLYEESLKAGEILAAFGRFTLRRMHLLDLAPGKNISGAIIDSYARCLTEALRGEVVEHMKPAVWVLPTRISVLCATIREEGLQRHIRIMQYAESEEWRRSFFGDIGACQKIVMPCYSLDDMHWFCAVVELRLHQIEIWDSLSHPKSRVRRGCTALEAVSMLSKIVAADLELAYCDGLDLPAFKVIHKKDVPTQENGHDCGIFTVLFMWAAATGNPIVHKFDVNSARFALGVQLVRSSLNTVAADALNAAYNHSKDIIGRCSLQETSKKPVTDEGHAVKNPSVGKPNRDFSTKKRRSLRWGCKS